MSQLKIYEPAGSLQVIAGEEYNHTNLPLGCTVVELQMGERLTDANGNKTPLRGVRMTITHNITPATNPKPEIPFIWIEGTQIGFNKDYTYTFHNNGIVGYGKEITP